MPNANIPSSGITEMTPKRVVFGAGTLHANLVCTAGEWNFNETLIGTTNGGGTLTITPEIADIEVDGRNVKMKGLAVKTGEVATMEVTLCEWVPENIRRAIIGTIAASTTAEGFNEITTKDQLEDNDYLTNFAWVGKNLAGEPWIILFENALCTSGFSSTTGPKAQADQGSVTFECYSDLKADGTTLPVHFYYPAETTEETGGETA